MTPTTKERIKAKDHTPEADAAVEAHLATVQRSIVVEAERVSGTNEKVMASDVYAAIAFLSPERPRFKTLGEWFKWVGFGVLGAFFPQLVALANANPVDKSQMWWAIGCLIVAFILLGSSFGFDVANSKVALHGRRRHR